MLVDRGKNEPFNSSFYKHALKNHLLRRRSFLKWFSQCFMGTLGSISETNEESFSNKRGNLISTFNMTQGIVPQCWTASFGIRFVVLCSLLILQPFSPNALHPPRPLVQKSQPSGTTRVCSLFFSSFHLPSP